MRKIFLSIIFLFLSHSTFSQVYKLRSTLFASRQVFNNYWTDWTSWVPSSVLIVAETENQRVRIYSQTPQTYDMIESVITTYDKDSLPIYTVMCIDENGTRCKMVWYNTKDDDSYVLFQFSNLELMYKVFRLD
jgi:hypothetical protein